MWILSALLYTIAGFGRSVEPCRVMINMNNLVWAKLWVFRHLSHLSQLNLIQPDYAAF